MLFILLWQAQPDSLLLPDFFFHVIRCKHRPREGAVYAPTCSVGRRNLAGLKSAPVHVCWDASHTGQSIRF